MQKVVFKDLGNMKYGAAWDYQELLLKENVDIKSQQRNQQDSAPLIKTDLLKEQVPADETGTENPLIPSTVNSQPSTYSQPSTLNGHSLKSIRKPDTRHHLLFVEHPPVYTLGKSGHSENILITSDEMESKGIQFYKTNRGGDITFHGPGQLVGYPILDLEKFYTDIGIYLRNLEEVILLTLTDYGITGSRSAGETGVWLDAGIKGRERKICAMGVRCSRWITMHGFAFNISTDLTYFSHIIPCGIHDKSVTSLEKELGKNILMEEVKEKVKRNFEKVFQVILI